MIIKNPFMQDENLNEMSWPNSYSINDNTGVRDKTAIVQFALLTEIQEVYSLKRSNFLQSVLSLKFFSFQKHKQCVIVSKTEGCLFLSFHRAA